MYQPQTLIKFKKALENNQVIAVKQLLLSNPKLANAKLDCGDYGMLSPLHLAMGINLTNKKAGSTGQNYQLYKPNASFTMVAFLLTAGADPFEPPTGAQKLYLGKTPFCWALENALKLAHHTPTNVLKNSSYQSYAAIVESMIHFGAQLGTLPIAQVKVDIAMIKQGQYHPHGAPINYLLGDGWHGNVDSVNSIVIKLTSKINQVELNGTEQAPQPH